MIAASPAEAARTDRPAEAGAGTGTGAGAGAGAAPDAGTGRPSAPYVGPRPFERADAPLFFGRRRDVTELVALITAHPEVLLHSESGAGKTSLVNAALIPALEKAGFEVLPPARVRAAVGGRPLPDRVANVYAYNAICCWAGGAEPPEALASVTLSQYLLKDPPSEERRPRVVIFDQFEELFTSSPERWKDRAAFFEQVRDLLSVKGHRLRVMFVMREDYLGAMHPYADILPRRLRTRFRLERLRQAGALEAVRGPLAGTGRAFAPGVAEKVVQDLLEMEVPGAAAPVPGEYVEPVQLQIVCDRLWRSLKPGESEITPDHLKASGDVDQALGKFYDEVMEAAAAATGTAELRLREMFWETFITPAGTRATVFRGDNETGAFKNDAIDFLEHRRLVRAEWRAGARWYELTHDRFVGPIRTSNQRAAITAGPAALTRRRLEDRAKHWAEHGRVDPLLTVSEFVAFGKWYGTPAGREAELSPVLREYLHASQAQFLVKFIPVAATVAAVFLGLAIWAFVARRGEAAARREVEAALATSRLQREVTDLIIAHKGDEAREKLERVRAYYADTARDPAGAAEALNGAARAFAETGRIEDAESLYARAEEMARNAGDAARRQRVDSLSGLGKIHESRFFDDDKEDEGLRAEAFYQQALEVERRLWGPDDRRQLDTLHSLAALWEDSGTEAGQAKAVRYYRELVALRAKDPSADATRWFTEMATLASLLVESQDEAGADQVRRDLLERTASLGDGADVEVAWALSELARTYARRGGKEAALAAMKEAVRLADHPGRPAEARPTFLLTVAGRLFLDLGQLPEARDAFERTLAAYDRPDAKQRHAPVDVLTTLGSIYLDQALPDKAGEMLARARASAAADTDNDPADNARALAEFLRRLAAAALRSGARERALGYADEGLTYLEKVRPPDAEVVAAYDRYAKLLDDAGDRERANRVRGRAEAIREGAGNRRPAWVVEPYRMQQGPPRAMKK